MATQATKKNKSTAIRALLSMACAVIIIAGLKSAQSMILPIILAIFVATASYPFTRILMRVKVPRFLAVFFTLILDCGFLVGIAVLLNYLSKDFQDLITTKYQPMLLEKLDDLNQWLTLHHMENLLTQTTDALDANSIVSVTAPVFGVAASILSISVLVLILMTFFLAESHIYKDNLKRINIDSEPNLKKLINACSDIQRYLGIKTIISLITGGLAWILCFAVNLDFPLVWGLLAFALNFIPTIGSIVAAIPPVILALILYNPAIALIVALGYVAINFLLGNFLEPTLLGKQFGIATSVVLLSVIFWGFIWGPIGMLLAVPLTLVIKLAMENTKDFQWIATLISKQESIPTLAHKSPNNDSHPE